MIKSFLKLAGLAVVMSGSIMANREIVEIKRSELFVPEKLGNVKLFHHDTGFAVLKDGKFHEVKNCFVDKQVRNKSNKELGYFLGTLKDFTVNGKTETFERVIIKDEALCEKILASESNIGLNEEECAEICADLQSGSYLMLNEMSDGEYVIHAKPRGLGGGFWGGLTGYLIGKTVVHVVGQGVIYGVAGTVGIFCPPAFLPVLTGMQCAMLPAIEAASNTVGLGTAVVGMVATGPV